MLPLVLFCQSKNLDAQQLALNGYDAVSYFSAVQPTQGKATISVEWEGAIYHFSSEANKTLFKENPTAYLPQYGGWCAFAMAKGKTEEVNPKAYIIQENKLYLFYKTRWVDTQKKWQENPQELRDRADINWEKFRGRK